MTINKEELLIPLRAETDHDKSEGWAMTIHMRFNKNKCWILHLEQGQLWLYIQTQGGQEAEEQPREKESTDSSDGKMELSQQYIWQPEWPTVP